MATDITRPTKATGSLTRSCSMSTHGATTMVTAWLTCYTAFLTTTTTPVVTLCDITNPSGAGGATCTFTVPAGVTTNPVSFGDTTFYTSEFSMTVDDGTTTTSYDHGDAAFTPRRGYLRISISDSYDDGNGFVTVTYDDDPIVVPATVTPYGTVLDTDDDNDGTPDTDDAFPFDATEDTDADGDGIGANTDQVENDACYSVDTDGDGYPDAGTGIADCTPTLVEDNDDDADGIANADDCNVSNATQMYDTGWRWHLQLGRYRRRRRRRG